MKVKVEAKVKVTMKVEVKVKVKVKVNVLMLVVLAALWYPISLHQLQCRFHQCQFPSSFVLVVMPRGRTRC